MQQKMEPPILPPPPLPPQIQQTIIIIERKSQLVSLLLTFFLGPLGLLYSTVIGGIINIVIWGVAFIFGILTFGLGLLIFPLLWIICIVWGAIAVSSYNKSQMSGLIRP